MWSHSNFDRIARETGNKYLNEHLEDREERKYKESALNKYLEMTKDSRKYFYDTLAKQLTNDNIFLRGVQWDNEFARDNAKIGSTLKIKLPGTSVPLPRSSPIPLMQRVKTWLMSLSTRR